MNPVELLGDRKVRRYIINEFKENDLNFLNEYCYYIYAIPLNNSPDQYNCFVFDLPSFLELYNSKPEIDQHTSTSIIKSIIESADQGFNEIEFII